MKRYIIYTTITIALIGFSGCKDFLQENPKNFVSTDNFYNNQSEIKSALSGIYAILTTQGFTRGRYFQNQIGSEYTWAFKPTTQEVGYSTITPTWRVVGSIWSDSYRGIKRANAFINKLEKADVKFSQSLKQRYLGEAKFLRAYSYYGLVEWFGDVPLITKTYSGSDNFLVARTKKSKVWKQVRKDLNDAIKALPPKSAYSGPDISRINKGAAETLLAKIDMIQEKWQSAKKLVDKIIASGEYSLEEDIKNNWDIGTEFGKESIFEINFTSGKGPSSDMTNYTGPPGLTHPLTGMTVGGFWGGVSYIGKFYNSFSGQDERKTKLFFDKSLYEAAPERYYTSKYFDPKVQHRAGNNPNNFVVFRYADILLMKAEIENELDKGPNSMAYNAIDKVRNRVNVPNLEKGLNYSDFLDSVFAERGKELFFEGHRFFDLKRRGIKFLKKFVVPGRKYYFNQVGSPDNLKITKDYLVLPIPLTEVDANPKLEQNPGY